MGVFDLSGFHSEIASRYGVAMPDFCPDGKFYRAGRDQHAWAIGTILTVQNKIYATVFYGSWSSGDGTQRWNSYTESSLSARSLAQIKRDIKAHQKKIDLERERVAEETANRYEPVFAMASIGDVHPYMVSKGLGSNYVAKVLGAGELAIPMRLNGKFRSVQLITRAGAGFDKKFPFGTGKRGASCLVGDGPGHTIFISEGFATACSVYEAMPDYKSYCAFDCGNLLSVAQVIRKDNPESPIIVCADNDASRAGVKAAQTCVNKVSNLSYVMPKQLGQDFNDVYVSEGAHKLTDILTQHLSGAHKWPSLDDGFITKVIADSGKEKIIKHFDQMYEYFAAQCGLIYARELKAFYAYNQTYYAPLSDDDVRSACERLLGVQARGFDREEFLKLCRARAIRDFDDFFKDSMSINFVNLKNGVIDLKSGRLLPHDKRYKFRYQIDNEIDMNMKCPTWEQFIGVVTKNRQHLADNIEEFIGFILSGESYFRFNSALILDGAGSNGKSTLIEAIMHIVGVRNLSAAPLHQMSGNRFLTHKLATSLVNVSEEEPKTVFSESGIFKKLTGNSTQFAEDKGKTGYSFINKSKILISYNEMPFLGDESTGMLRRLLVIPCEENLDVNPGLKIKNVMAKLRVEIPGIIARCLRAYVRLSDRGYFNISQETKARVDQMRRESNPVRDWALDMIRVKPGSEVRTEVLWESFEDYVGKNGRLGKIGFMKKLISVCRAINDTGSYVGTEVRRVNLNGVSKLRKALVGIELKEEKSDA